MRKRFSLLEKNLQTPFKTTEIYLKIEMERARSLVLVRNSLLLQHVYRIQFIHEIHASRGTVPNSGCPFARAWLLLNSTVNQNTRLRVLIGNKVERSAIVEFN